MRRISFFKNNRSDDILHIETEGCIVNIHVNLINHEGKRVTAIEILPDRMKGEEWRIDTGSSLNRVIESPEG